MTPISSFSSPPGMPVPCAVEPTSTRRMVDAGSGGISSIGSRAPGRAVEGSSSEAVSWADRRCRSEGYEVAFALSAGGGALETED